MSQSPELAGGSGFTFEGEVASACLAALLGEEEAVGLPGRRVVRVAVQQRDAGEPLDDLVVDARASDGSTARLSLQVKTTLVISAAARNDDFRSIVRDCWKTIDKPDFRLGVDRFGAATQSVAMGKARALETLCELARASATAADLETRFSPQGSASQDVTGVLEDLRSITRDLGRADEWGAMHRVLSHFVLLTFDAMHDGATVPAAVSAMLRNALRPDAADQAPLLLDRLRTLARHGAGRARVWTRRDLLYDVAPHFALRGARSLALDLGKISVATRAAARDIEDEIGDVRLARTGLEAAIDRKLGTHRFVQVHGLPGSGKSVLLRRRVEAALARGPVLLLKADRIEGDSWSTHAGQLGLACPDPEVLLAEIGAVGMPTLFVDGIDRIDRAQRGVVNDLVRTILDSASLSAWRILVTLRDGGIEPLRTWLPRRLFDLGMISTVEVGPLDDDEAKELAQGNPALKPLLFGAGNVRDIVRRPFFAKILALGGMLAEPTPQSEIDLIDRWWERGGFDSLGLDAITRQRALVELAMIRAPRTEAPIPLASVPHALLPAVPQLREDGVVQDVRVGHTVRFSHDIFFEWALLHHLVDAGENWPARLRAAGEPPAIGRVVELLAQVAFERDETWAGSFAPLRSSDLRPQWIRAWLLGPLGLPGFLAREAIFHAVAASDEFALLRLALVWFQAEKTRPNPAVLNGTSGTVGEDRDVRLRVADMLGWPSDRAIWSRFLAYLHRHLDELPVALIPAVVTVFDVWQNMHVDVPNRISAMLIAYCDRWLGELDARIPTSLRSEPKSDRWDDLPNGPELLAQSLRRLLLRSARVEPNRVGDYLGSFVDRADLLDQAFAQIVTFAPVIAETHPESLVKLTLLHLLEELPDDRMAREQREEDATHRRVAEARAKPDSERTREDEHFMSGAFSRLGFSSISHSDWESLAIDCGRTDYSPASPLREPFHSLFRHAPDEALSLIRHLTNHAMEAWRQCHRLDRRRTGTPIPFTVHFPWSDQAFWGGDREYLWSRGLWAPKPLGCAYLALDSWALEELAKGADADKLIERIVTGNESIAVLGTAIAVALASMRVSDTTQALIATQRLWHADVVRIGPEPSIRSSSQNGLSSSDRAHAKAVESLNTNPVRQAQLRQLVALHVLGQDQSRANAMLQAILGFADNPPFEFEEERDHPEARKEYEKRARTNAAWGAIENYRRVTDPGEPRRQAVIHVNPEAESDEEQEQIAEGRAFLTASAICRWAERSFADGAVADGFGVSPAMDLAKSLDRPDLFRPSQEDEHVGMLRGAVAGAAAVIVALDRGRPHVDLEWAHGVISRAAATQEVSDGLWSSVNIVSWHPCIFAARAFAAELRVDASDRATAHGLLRLAAHPLDCVAVEATRQILSLWRFDPHLSWTGLRLVLALCTWEPGVPGGGGPLHNPDFDSAGRAAKVEVAIGDLDSVGWPELPLPLPAWLPPEEGAGDDAGRAVERDDDKVRPKLRRPKQSGWRRPRTVWDSQAAAKALAMLPVDDMLATGGADAALLAYVNAMFAWTADCVAPPFDRTGRGDARSTDHFEWVGSFAGLLGRIIGHLPIEQVHDRFLGPICALDDAPCFSLLSPMIRSFICAHVLDSARIASPAVPVMETALTRLLAAREFDRDGYHAGEMHGFDLPQLAQAFFFVWVDKALGAARFANGDWSGIATMLPVVDRFVREAGWASAIMADFLTLCERARDAYPIDSFADGVLEVMSGYTEGPPSWHGTLIPARIAALVQHFSERAAPLSPPLGQKLLRILDRLVDLGDRRSAALQLSPAFRDLRQG